jgi:hypothetical protein
MATFVSTINRVAVAHVRAIGWRLAEELEDVQPLGFDLNNLPRREDVQTRLRDAIS